MRETNLVAQIIAYLKQQGAWYVKYHGGPYSRPGVPDLLVCFRGRFYAFEVKVPGKERTTTAMQWREISRIAEAGGHAAVVSSIGQVQELLNNV